MLQGYYNSNPICKHPHSLNNGSLSLMWKKNEKVVKFGKGISNYAEGRIDLNFSTTFN